MRYELAIMLPKTDEEAANLLGLSLLCVTVITGLTVPALYFGGDALLPLLRAPGLAPYLILVPVFVFISGVFLALFTSITSIIGVIACMPLASSRSYSRRLTKTANLLGLCLLRVAVVSRLTVPALYFGGDAVRSLHGAPGPGSYFILVSPFVFAGWCFLR